MKIGIMSFAHHHAEAYIQAVRSIPEIDLLGVADETIERARRQAEQHNTHCFESYEALIAAKPDGVIICTENNKHLPLVEMAAKAGVHVLCEKPIATNLKDAGKIVAVCKQAGVWLMTAFPMRFSSPLREVKNLLDKGELGNVFCFNGVNQGELPIKHRAWFVDKDLAGGGAVMDHTVHLIDIMRWYLGSEVVEVYAQTNHIFYANQVDVETGGLLMVTFESGVFASIDCSWSRPPYYPSWGGLGFEMITERGAVIVDGFKQNLTIYRQDLQRPLWSYWGSDINRAMIVEFGQAISQNRKPYVDGVDGYRAVEVALAAYESAKTGQPVRIK
jgi:predicted dehydrogenase